MSLFRRHQTPSAIAHARAALASSLRIESDKKLRQLANCLATIEKRMSRPQKMISISFFCLAGIFFSLALLLRAIWLPPPKSVSFLAKPGIARPVLPPLTDSIIHKQMQARLADTPSSALPSDSVIKK